VLNGVVAAYSFNEGTGSVASDQSGNGNNGTIENAAWSLGTGRFGGNALLFNGTNARVTINDSPSLDLTNGLTLEAWVDPSGATSGWRAVLVKEDGSLAADYMLYAYSQYKVPVEGLLIGTGEKSLGGKTKLPLSTWTHLAATYDGATQRLYVNGQQVASNPQSGPIKTGNGKLRIGGDAVWGEYFSGIIDEVRIYNRALSVGEIADDMYTPLK
jgi:hypothetical protein